MTRTLADLQAELGTGYRLERELGRGGMATVYLALDTKHQRQVALKLLRADLGVSLAPERFRREVALVARLQHPHILPLLDSGETSAGQLWFTMPFVQGESLRDRLRREPQLPIDTALRLARQAAGALDYAHRHGVIHRDMKPENILVTHDGDALVADFGIARAVTPDEASRAHDSGLTETGIAIGTPCYMSPEQASGDRTIDARTDVYSLGVVLYEMLAGTPPHAGSSPRAMLVAKLAAEAPSVRRTRPEVSGAIDAVVRKALAAAPEDRHPTAADLDRALDQAAQGVMPRRSRRIPSPVVALLTFLVLATAALATWRSRGIDRPTSAASAAVRLAVLPFENLGDSADAYFADGVTDAVRARLTSLVGLEIIGSSSSEQYRRTSKPSPQIGRELEARYLLQGKVRWAKPVGGVSRVQVTPELVDAETGTTRWAQPFDAPLNDVFQVQGDIAARVARELQVALTPIAERALASRATADLAAYDAYLRGRNAEKEGLGSAALERAATLYRDAVVRDSMFALAWAALGDVLSLAHTSSVQTAALADSADQASARALALAPHLADVRTARADYYAFVRRDFARALHEAEAGLAREPTNTQLLRRTALIEASLGRWDAAAAHATQASLWDPLDAPAFHILGDLELRRRNFAAAQTALERAMALRPRSPGPAVYRAMLELARGDLPSARRMLRAAASQMDEPSLLAYVASLQLGWVLDSIQEGQLLALGPAAFDGDRGSWAIALAEQYARRGDHAQARTYADTARAALEAQLRGAPNDPHRRVQLGLALAYLGRKSEAIRAGEAAVALNPVSKDQGFGPFTQHTLARIYVLLGEPSKALDALTPLLQMPYLLSPARLRLDPDFAALRSDPRFGALTT